MTCYNVPHARPDVLYMETFSFHFSMVFISFIFAMVLAEIKSDVNWIGGTIFSEFWTAHDSTVRIISISLHTHSQPHLYPFNHRLCVEIVTATAGLLAAKVLWQVVPVCTRYYQFGDSLGQPVGHKLFATHMQGHANWSETLKACNPLVC